MFTSSDPLVRAKEAFADAVRCMGGKANAAKAHPVEYDMALGLANLAEALESIEGDLRKIKKALNVK